MEAAFPTPAKSTPSSPPEHYPRPRPRSGPVTRRRIPAFHPVPLGPRTDGWTPERQAQFIGCLAELRSVLAACRRVSMGREGAYRLRKRPGAAGFAAAWGAARFVGIRQKPDHSAHLQHLANLDRACAKIDWA